ncbi:receptor-like protein kinase HERK 1 [Rutidosis leptorrhynchoides]|uniref:receptor-like protein kinase HERK 1 n=1 Tax=Rutidosis leptorrhynchoides TaxID=125765 RepID=UPI003A99B025
MAHLDHFQHLKIQLQVINSATNNFAEENCIGKGGFGKVYLGKFVDGSKGEMLVAWKRLNPEFGQGDSEFWKEIMMLSFYRHENIISLIGYCDDQNEKIIAYEYASKRSLDLHLDTNDLTWIRRLNICIGAARGLEYLHAPSETQLRVLHRDIKSSNILLDDNWNAKISDFGLSKFGPANHILSYLITNKVGTRGYCDPLYEELGFLTKESDVYSFGVVLFEVLCGRLCFGNNKRRPLLGLVRQSYEKNLVNEIVHDSIKEEIEPESLKVFTEIAYQCLNKKREERPSMTQMVEALELAVKCQVKVIRAFNLKKKSLLTSTKPYVILKLTQSSLQCAKKTSVKDKATPEWNEEFDLYVENLDVQCLHICLLNATSRIDDLKVMRSVLAAGKDN